jgi:hypothetical protein
MRRVCSGFALCWGGLQTRYGRADGGSRARDRRRCLARAGEQILRSHAALSADSNPRAPRGRIGTIHARRLGWRRLLVARGIAWKAVQGRVRVRASFLPTTRRCRCSIPAEDARRPGDCGSMLAMSRSDLEKLEPGDLLCFRRSLWMRENWKGGSRAGGAFARTRDAFHNAV